MKKSEMEQLIADHADEIANLIEELDRVMTIKDKAMELCARAVNYCEQYRAENEKLHRTIHDIINHSNDIKDIHFPNTEKET